LLVATFNMYDMCTYSGMSLLLKNIIDTTVETSVVFVLMTITTFNNGAIG